MLRQRRSHEEAAIRAALDGEALRCRVSRVDEVLGAGGEVVEHVLLVEQLSLLVPRVPELASAAQVGDGDHHSLLEEDVDRVLIMRFQGDVESAVSGEERWILPVEARALRAQDAERNLGSVWRRAFLAGNLDVREIDRGPAEERGADRLFGSRIDAKVRRRL